MLTEYIDAAMQHAVYKCISDERPHYREIPGLRGVSVNADTLEQCRKELQKVLQDWLTLSIGLGHDIPSIEGISLATSRGTRCPS